MVMFVHALALAAAAAGATSGDGVVWHWDTDTQICALRQQVGAIGRIELSRTPANNQTVIWVTLQSASHVRGGHWSGFIELGSREKVPAEVYEQSDDGKIQVSAITQDPNFLKEFSSSDSLLISNPNFTTPQIAVESSSDAATALHSCEEKKMRAWGIDPAAWETLKSPPVPVGVLTDRFSNLDYPRDALAFLVTGDAVTRLDIGPDGKVKQCRSLNASQYRGFEFATCNILRGARFTPALDSAGQPVTAPYVVDVSFRMAS